MQPHCYYLSVSSSLSWEDCEKGRLRHHNFKIFSSKRGEALADDFADQVQEKLRKLNGGTLDGISNISIDNIFDCGEEPETSDETI